MKAETKVSFIVPVYNCAAYLEAAIASVLRQSDPHWQLWLVDDASSDRSAEICAHYACHDQRIHFVQQQRNSGQYHIVNRYSAACNASYNSILDGDDQLAPDYLAQMYAFAEQQQCDIVLSSHRARRGRRRLLMHQRPRRTYCAQSIAQSSLLEAWLHGAFPLPDSGILVRTSLRQSILPQLPSFPLYAATDDLQGFFLARELDRQQGRIGHIGQALYHRNLNSPGTWLNQSAEFRLKKTTSILFAYFAIKQELAASVPLCVHLQAVAGCYMLNWLRHNLLQGFCGLTAPEQVALLHRSIAELHRQQDTLHLSKREQVELALALPSREEPCSKPSLKRRLRRTVQDLLPYGYVRRKKRPST